MTLLVLYEHGYNLGKYISIERIVEQSKKTYYESLNTSSQKWHQTRHDVFPWFNYFLGTILQTYKEFEERAGNVKPGRGVKTQMVIQAIERQAGDFTISDIEKECFGVSREMLKVVFWQLRKQKKSLPWKRKGSKVAQGVIG